MSFKKYTGLAVSLLVLTGFLDIRDANAGGRFAVGPEVGMTAQSQSTASGDKLGWTFGVPFGVQGVYQFQSLPQFGIDYAVGYSFLPRLTVRKTTIGGVTGTYRENTSVLYWFVGGRYYFHGEKWKPFAGLGSGFEYFRRSGVEFRDQFNTLQPTPPHSNNFNFALVPQFGIEFRPTFRWAIGMSLRVPIALRSSGIVPAIQIPLTVQFVF